jgi:putative SOS response-associated peptidase YedK
MTVLASLSSLSPLKDATRPARCWPFAGIWSTWRGTRGTKANPVEGEHHLFGSLTTDANAVVEPIHPTPMPVILRNEAEFEGWLTTSADLALTLQRPMPDDELMIVATGERKDEAA